MKRSLRCNLRVLLAVCVYSSVAGFVLYSSNVDAKTKNTPPTPPTYYGPALCKHPQYDCIKVQSGQNWNNLFPDEKERDLVQRVNRTYNWIGSGRILAVPKNLSKVTLLEIAPFPQHIDEQEKQVIVD